MPDAPAGNRSEEHLPTRADAATTWEGPPERHSTGHGWVEACGQARGCTART
ncbi:hypothetical protein Srubr_28400 [Streptomyces rubradiris]|uniref:Uncharacterized protein n=1 Tax=Streptomyces rubradiris TaxID=285531 RepID=A0ABQ3RAW4_STRRR|nr:hypothetical protein GCM10018792_51280 [Streptomyces rubradiris]GHI52994.1 hypothetical protein Srubr_28400 [Streptomyces rubradiris]